MEKRKEKKERQINFQIKDFEFSKSPNLKYQEDIVSIDGDWFGINDIFDIYYILKEKNILYLASPSVENIISITKIKDKKNIIKLKANIGALRMIRHFFNSNDKNDYLFASGRKLIVNIWNISNKFELKYSIKTGYSENTNIFSCLLYCNQNNNNPDYIITSSNETESTDSTKIFSFINGKFINFYENTSANEIFYLLVWKFPENNKDYLIQTSMGKLLINDIISKKNEGVLECSNNSELHTACIIKKNNSHYLYVTSVNETIEIFDLYKKQRIFVIEHAYYFFHMISWSNNFLIAANKWNNGFTIIDTNCNKIISLVLGQHENMVICLKKIIHPLYGESLLTGDFHGEIKLWIIKN